MTITTIHVAGLPDNVEVRTSTRRRRTVSAQMRGEVTVVTVPASMSHAAVRAAVDDLLRRMERRTPHLRSTDSALMQRAAALRLRYVPEAPMPTSVTWSGRQNRRWGSCTPTDRTIRISHLLRSMPSYVVDAVLIHELAHLVHADHGTAFRQLVARHSEHDRARAYLDGYDHARNLAAESPA